MTLHACRDWRGIKNHLSQFSTEEVRQLRHTAQQTSEQIARFIITLDTELTSRRNADLGPPSARALWASSVSGGRWSATSGTPVAVKCLAARHVPTPPAACSPNKQS